MNHVYAIGVILVVAVIVLMMCMFSSRLSRHEEHSIMVRKVRGRRQWAILDVTDPRSRRVLAWIPSNVDPGKLAYALGIPFDNGQGVITWPE